MNWIIKTAAIMVRPIEISDTIYFYKWWNDGELMKDVGFKNGLNITYEKIEEDFIKKINLHSIDPTKLFIIYDAKMNIPIGELSYGELDLNERSCRIGMKICETKMQGRGYGHHSLCEFLKYLFNELDLNIIYIDTLSSNKRAINLYQKIGCDIIETKKDFWTNPEGISCDAIFFKIDRSVFSKYYH